MGNNISQEKQRRTVMGSIMGLMRALENLAPHPDRPHDKGPLFVKSDPHCKIAGEHEGMLGQFFMESLLGTAFSEVVSDSFGGWAQSLDLGNIAECASEMIKDREGEGQGSFALCKRRAISNDFNFKSVTGAAKAARMEAFLHDLPVRLRIEGNLAFYIRRLHSLKETIPAPISKMAASIN